MRSFKKKVKKIREIKSDKKRTFRPNSGLTKESSIIQTNQIIYKLKLSGGTLRKK